MSWERHCESSCAARPAFKFEGQAGNGGQAGPGIGVLSAPAGVAEADAGAEGAAGFLGAGCSAFFEGARIAWSVVPSMRGMNSTRPASPISRIRRLMIL